MGTDEISCNIDDSEEHIHDIEKQADHFEDHGDPIYHLLT